MAYVPGQLFLVQLLQGLAGLVFMLFGVSPGYRRAYRQGSRLGFAFLRPEVWALHPRTPAPNSVGIRKFMSEA